MRATIHHAKTHSTKQFWSPDAVLLSFLSTSGKGQHNVRRQFKNTVRTAVRPDASLSGIIQKRRNARFARIKNKRRASNPADQQVVPRLLWTESPARGCESAEMDRDDDEGVGFIAESHYLKSPTHQQAMALLQVPSGRQARESSISSSVSDLDVPIYSSENLTTRSSRPVESVSTHKCRVCWILKGKIALLLCELSRLKLLF